MTSQEVAELTRLLRAAEDEALQDATRAVADRFAAARTVLDAWPWKRVVEIDASAPA